MDFFLNIIPTTKCNKNCHYCDRKVLVDTVNTIDIDIDKLLHNLRFFKDDNLYIELSGGEPGLISNLYEVITTLKKEKYINKINLLSNGLVRKNTPEVIPLVDYYYEHLILDINNKNISMFYDDLSFEYKDNMYCVIVATMNTIDSIINNFEYYNNKNFFGDNIIYKMLINKTDTSVINIELVKKFYESITSNQTNINRTLDLIKRFSLSDKELSIKRNYCGIMAYNLYINTENNVIGHCSLYYSNSNEVELNLENLKKLKNRLLFKKENYCDNCYWYKDYNITDIIKNKRNYSEYVL